MKKRFNNPQAEFMRIISEYRRKILMDRISIEPDILKRFIGPDRACHIYKMKTKKKQ